MVEQDTSAFVETISAPRRDRKAEKLERLAVKAEVEYRKAALRARLQRDLSAIEHGRDPRGNVADLDFLGLQKDLERMRERSERLRQEAKERQSSSASVVSHRLHSRNHYIDCSEERYAAWLRRQKVSPVLVATTRGSRWWWFLDRFWWDDEGLGAEGLRKRVLQDLRFDRSKRDETERARSTLLEVERTVERTVLPESLLDDVGWTPPAD